MYFVMIPMQYERFGMILRRKMRDFEISIPLLASSEE